MSYHHMPDSAPIPEPQNLIFEQTLSAINEVIGMMPIDLKPSEDTLDFILLLNEKDYTNTVYENLVAMGAKKHVAAYSAGRTVAFEKSGYLRETQKFIVKPFPADAEGLIDPQDYYTSMIGFAIAGELIPEYRDVPIEKVCQALLMAEDDFRNLVLEEIIVREVADHIAKSPDEAFEEIGKRFSMEINEFVAGQGIEPGTPAYHLTRKFLQSFFGEDMDSLITLLEDKFKMQHSEIASMINVSNSDLRFDLFGREVGIRRRGGRFINEAGHMGERRINDVVFNTYSYYIHYLLFCKEKLLDQYDTSENLEQFEKSDRYRRLLNPEELILPSVIEAAKKLGGFENLLRILINSQDIEAVDTGLDEIASNSVRSIAEASQAQEIIKTSSLTLMAHPEITMQIPPDTLIMGRYFEFYLHVLGIIEGMDMPTVKKASLGALEAERHLQLDLDYDPQAEPDVIRIFREVLAEADVLTPADLIRRARFYLIEARLAKGEK